MLSNISRATIGVPGKADEIIRQASLCTFVSFKSKNLGAFIDSRLNFHSHIKSVENKVARSVGILSKLKHFLPSNSLLKLYHAFSHPVILIVCMVYPFAVVLTYLTYQNYRHFKTKL